MTSFRSHGPIDFGGGHRALSPVRKRREREPFVVCLPVRVPDNGPLRNACNPPFPFIIALPLRQSSWVEDLPVAPSPTGWVVSAARPRTAQPPRFSACPILAPLLIYRSTEVPREAPPHVVGPTTQSAAGAPRVGSPGRPVPLTVGDEKVRATALGPGRPRSRSVGWTPPPPLGGRVSFGGAIGPRAARLVEHSRAERPLGPRPDLLLFTRSRDKVGG
jgi:hypothetical protein